MKSDGCILFCWVLPAALLNWNPWFLVGWTGAETGKVKDYLATELAGQVKCLAWPSALRSSARKRESPGQDDQGQFGSCWLRTAYLVTETMGSKFKKYGA